MSSYWGPDPFGGRGYLLVDNPDHRVWIYQDESGVIHQCDQTIETPLFEQNQRALNESQNKRFGDGQIVASIPLPMYFEKFVPARKQGDTKYINKLLNDSDYEKLRTFRGRL